MWKRACACTYSIYVCMWSRVCCYRAKLKLRMSSSKRKIKWPIVVSLVWDSPIYLAALQILACPNAQVQYKNAPTTNTKKVNIPFSTWWTTFNNTRWSFGLQNWQQFNQASGLMKIILKEQKTYFLCDYSNIERFSSMQELESLKKLNFIDTNTRIYSYVTVVMWFLCGDELCLTQHMGKA